MLVDLDMKKVKDASMILRALRNSLREGIFTVIGEHPGITVTELYRHLHIEQTVVSKHLAILRRSGIVRTEREGKKIHYYLDETNINTIALLVEQLAGFAVPARFSLKE